MGVNPDFRDLLRALNDAGARFLIVGAHAVAYHAEPRYTKGLDVWVEPTKENAEKVWRGLTGFGAPMEGVAPNDFANKDLIYQIGIEPNRIEPSEGVRKSENAYKSAARKPCRAADAPS